MTGRKKSGANNKRYCANAVRITATSQTKKRVSFVNAERKSAPKRNIFQKFKRATMKVSTAWKLGRNSVMKAKLRRLTAALSETKIHLGLAAKVFLLSASMPNFRILKAGMYQKRRKKKAAASLLETYQRCSARGKSMRS